MVSPTGGTVSGNLRALFAGKFARLAFGCTILTDSDRLVITEVPLGVAVAEIVTQVAARVNAMNFRPDGRRYADYLPPGQQPERRTGVTRPLPSARHRRAATLPGERP